MKKNVLLDFNALISAHYNKLSKTGIYYVQYNIIKNLLNNYSNEFNFFAYAICGKKIFKNVVDTDYPEFKNIQYFNDLPLSQRILNYIRFQKQNLKRQKFKFFKKIFVKLYLIFLQIARLFIKLFFNKKEITIKNINIYQSFYEKIPDFILNNEKIKAYNFIHDLLPITNPEYFSKNLEETKNRFYNHIKSFIYTSKNFVISQYTINEINKFFSNVKKENLILNYLASDTKKYFKIENLDSNIKNNVLSKYNIPLNKKYFLSLSSLNKRKNLAFLVESFVEFLEKNKNIDDLVLVLAGPSGWLMEEMFASIKNTGKYKDKIILTGFVDDKDLNIVYNSACAFIFPSLAEGFGLPVLEALSCGVPTISSNSTSLPEVYGDSALSFNPTKKEELVDAMKKIYFDNNLRDQLIESSFNQIKKFSWDKTTEIIVNEYRK